MDPSLVRVLGELPESVREAIFGLGIRSPGDFHHFWPSAQKCYEELEALTGEKMEAQGAMKVAVAWTNARRCSLQATEALGLEIARERQSSVGGPPPLPRCLMAHRPTRSGSLHRLAFRRLCMHRW